MDPIFQSEVPVYFGSLMQIIDDFDEVLQPNMRAVIFKVLATVFNIYEEPDDRIKNVKRLYKWCVQQRLFSFTQGVQDQWNDWIAKKTEGMSETDRNKFIEDLDDLRCDKAGKFHWYFFGAQLLSVLLTFFLMPLYLCN